MSLSPYLSRLRRAVGSALLLVPSVTVLPRDDEGSVLLVRDKPTGSWKTIGGSVEPGESPAEAAVREAKEEAGVDVELDRIVTAVGGTRYEVHYPNGDHVAYVGVVFEARVIAGEPRPDGVETDDARWYPLGEIGALDLDSFAVALFADLGWA